MSQLDPFEGLSYDKMVEICESLDDESLAQLTQTSKKAYETCQWILNEKRNQLKEELIDELVGGAWIACTGKDSIKGVFVSLKSNQQIMVFHSTSFQTLLSDMKIVNKGKFFLKIINPDDILELRGLRKELLEGGYKKIESGDEIFATKYFLHGDEYITIHNYPPSSQKDLRQMTRIGLINVLENLNVPIIGNETYQQLRDLIVQELDKRNKLITCQ